MSPIVVTVLPSPAGVGVIAVTMTSLPSTLSLYWSSLYRGIFAMYLPYGLMSSSVSPIEAATSVMGFTFADSAISISVSMIVSSQVLFKIGNYRHLGNCYYTVRLNLTKHEFPAHRKIRRFCRFYSICSLRSFRITDIFKYDNPNDSLFKGF